jgi:hypothetical protein
VQCTINVKIIFAVHHERKINRCDSAVYGLESRESLISAVQLGVVGEGAGVAAITCPVNQSLVLGAKKMSLG